MEILRVGGLDFEVRRSGRRQTLGVTVDRAGALVAHAPMETSLEELSNWIQRKLLWVHQKLAIKQEAISRVRAPEYVSGESFCYLGRRYRLKLTEQQRHPLQFDGTCFTLRRDALPDETHFRNWYIATGSDWLRRRTEILSRRTESVPKCVDIRDLGFRWGSCGNNGVIHFNWKSLQLPARLIDYVIVHELVHLHESGHGPAFSAALCRAMPNWQERKNALAKQAKESLIFGLTA